MCTILSTGALDTNNGSFHCLEELESHVVADDIVGGWISIGAGIEQAKSLLTATPPASVAFTVVITNANNSICYFFLASQNKQTLPEEKVLRFSLSGLEVKYSEHVLEAF